MWPGSEYKLGYVAAFLQSLAIDEEADDAFCEALCERCLSDPDKDVSYPLEVCEKEWGLAWCTRSSSNASARVDTGRWFFHDKTVSFSRKTW